MRLRTIQTLTVTIYLVKFPGSLCVRLSILPSDRQMHSMSLANVASNHALVRYVLPYLPPQLRFDPHIFEWVMSVHLTTLGNNFFPFFLLNAELSLQVLDRLR